MLKDIIKKEIMAHLLNAKHLFMFLISSAPILFSGVCAVPANAQDLAAALSEMIQSVQKDVDLLKENVVDIVSREEVTIEEVTIGENFARDGKPRKTTSIISEYRIFPEKNADKMSNCRAAIEVLADPQKLKNVLREERVVQSQNGSLESWLINAYLARMDNLVELLVTFDKRHENCFFYELSGVSEINGRAAFVITIRGKEEYAINAATGQGQTESGTLRYEGRAFIDAETMAIVKLSRSPMKYSLPNGGSYFIWVSHNYGKVRIKDQFLTLPVVKTVESFRDDNRKYLDTVWTYRYSDYKAFGVDTKITFGAIDE